MVVSRFASTFPDNVRKMVAVAVNAYVTSKEINISKKYQNIDSWSEKMRAPLIEIYGEVYFRRTWSNWTDAILRICEKQHGDLCKVLLTQIKCPSLIIQGTRTLWYSPSIQFT